MSLPEVGKALVKGSKAATKTAKKVPEDGVRTLAPSARIADELFDPDQSLGMWNVDEVQNFRTRTTPDANGYAIATQSAVTPEDFFRIIGQKPLKADDFTPQELELHRKAIENGELYVGIPSIKGKVGSNGIFEPDLSSVTREQMDLMNILYLDGNKGRVPVSFNFGDYVNEAVPVPTYVKSANGKLVSMPELPQLARNPRLEYKYNGKPIDDPRLGTMYTERMDSKSVIKYIFDPIVNQLHGNLADTMAMGGGQPNSAKAWDSYVDIYRDEGYLPGGPHGSSVNDIYAESLEMDRQAFAAVSPTVQQRIRSTPSPYTRELLGDTSPDKGMPLFFYRHDVSPMTDNKKTLAENKPLEGGQHMGIFYAYNSFKMRTDYSEGRVESIIHWNDLQKNVKNTFDKDTRKEVGKIMGAILREEYPDLNSSPTQHVDIDAEWNLWDASVRASRLRKFTQAMSPYTDKATAEQLAKQIEQQMRLQYRELDSAYIITGENPLPLWDKGSFHDAVIVEQLLAKKEFAKYKAELEDLSYDLMDPKDPAFAPAFKRQWDIVEEVGYDRYGLYVNRAEGGGAPSIVVPPGTIDKIGKKVMRSGTDYAQKLRDGRLAAIGLGFIDEDE